jgi:hypothetical protein
LNLNDEVIGMEKTSNTKKHKILNDEKNIRNKNSNKTKKIVIKQSK